MMMVTKEWLDYPPAELFFSPSQVSRMEKHICPVSECVIDMSQNAFSNLRGLGARHCPAFLSSQARFDMEEILNLVFRRTLTCP